MSEFGFAGSTVIVTGGAGFIGSHVVDALATRGARVRVIDDLSSGFSEFLRPDTELLRESLLDYDRILGAFAGADLVFHLAANADVRRGLAHPRRDIEQNLTVTHNVLEAMRAHGVRRIAFASSAAVYGDARVFPTPEDAPFPIQTSLYGASKLAAEGLLSAYQQGYGMSAWIFRFVSMLGPRYTHGHVFDFWRKLKTSPDRLAVLGDGKQKKSYIHVLDAVAAMLLALERRPSGLSVLNIGHHDCLTVADSVRLVCSRLAVQPEVEYAGGDRGWVGDSPRIELDTSRLRALGWAPRRSLPEAIFDTLRFLEENPYCGRRG